MIRGCIQKLISNLITHPEKIVWDQKLKDVGCHPVILTNFTDWITADSWCKERFGPRNFLWNNNIFWFETSEDALLFKLRFL